MSYLYIDWVTDIYENMGNVQHTFNMYHMYK